MCFLLHVAQILTVVLERHDKKLKRTNRNFQQNSDVAVKLHKLHTKQVVILVIRADEPISGELNKL